MKPSDCRIGSGFRGAVALLDLPLVLLALTGCQEEADDVGATNDRVIRVTPGCEFLQAWTDTPECGGPPERCEQVQGETRVREFHLKLDDTDIGPKEVERRIQCLEESVELTGAEQLRRGEERSVGDSSVVVHGTWAQLQYLVHSDALLVFDVRCDREGTLCQDCDGLDEEACLADAYCHKIRGTEVDLDRRCLGEFVFLMCASWESCEDIRWTVVDSSGQAFYTDCDDLPGYEYISDEGLRPSTPCSELPPERDASSDAGAP